MFTWNFQCSSLCLLALVLSVGTNEVQDCNSTFCPASSTQDSELYHLMITAAKVISSLHISNQTFFVSWKSTNTHLVGLTTTVSESYQQHFTRTSWTARVWLCFFLMSTAGCQYGVYSCKSFISFWLWRVGTELECCFCGLPGTKVLLPTLSTPLQLL